MPERNTAMTTEPETDPDGTSLRILLICTRDPRGGMSGRKMVLRTIIHTLTGLGHVVTVAYFPASAQEPEEDGLIDGANVHALAGPSPAERLASAVRWLATGTPSLNEGLYRSARAMAALEDLARDCRAQIVVTDMLRTAEYGARLGLPWVADLDDLLSRRYRLLSQTYDPQSNVLGYFRFPLGRRLLRFGSLVMPRILMREAAAIERREIDVATAANVTTLVSPAEAEALGRASGRPVRCAPMAVTGPPEMPGLTDRPSELVFLGGLDYGPNFKSLRRFDQHIMPRLAARGLGDLTLHVIGRPGQAANSFSEAVKLEGYVEDINAAMQRYRAMLVPEVLPGGLKTKIIVAAVNGTIVLAHPTAVEAMGLRHGREILVWETADDLAELILQMRSGDIDIGSMATAARTWAEETYSARALSDIWRGIVAEALARDSKADT